MRISTAALRQLENDQPLRGMSFTDFGKLVLDVSAVKDGRISLRQKGVALCVLPESLKAITDAIADARIPMPTPRESPFEIQTSSAVSPGQDHLNVLLDASGKNVEMADQKTGKRITVATRHLEEIDKHIVNPWMELHQAPAISID